ncbi:hypothetical protein HDU98_000751 [Podochytrium sp. JEL0797]|nr:hypothetical protein HDU98_000751 [Podochytrium sp. JEL0797]
MQRTVFSALPPPQTKSTSLPAQEEQRLIALHRIREREAPPPLGTNGGSANANGAAGHQHPVLQHQAEFTDNDDADDGDYSDSS